MLADDIRTPGTYFDFDDLSAVSGLVNLGRSVVLIGMGGVGLGGIAALNTAIQVGSEGAADLAAGVGTELALMARAAIKTQRKLKAAPWNGSMSEIWIVPIAAPVGGGAVAAARTVTWAGTATESGQHVVRVAGRLIGVAVRIGDSAATVAAAFDAAVKRRYSDLPVTVITAGAVNTLTATSAGVNGNAIKVTEVTRVPGLTATVVSSVVGVGVADVQPALDVLGARKYRIIALANHLAQDMTDLGEHMDAMWASDVKKWRFAVVGETGTLGTATTLASGQNRKELLVVSLEGGYSLPGEYAAAVAAMTQIRSLPNINWDSVDLPVYGTDDSLAYEPDELETAIAGGVTPLRLTETGIVQVVRLVTTKATEGGFPFEELRDYSVPKTASYTAEQCEAVISREMRAAQIDGRQGAELVGDLKQSIYGVLKELERLKQLHNIDAHADELQVEISDTVPTRAVSEIPTPVTPNLHQFAGTMKLIVEAPQ